MAGALRLIQGFIVVVKKTFRYSNVFFYNHLYRNSVIRNIIMESGIKSILIKEESTEIGSRLSSRYWLKKSRAEKKFFHP